MRFLFCVATILVLCYFQHVECRSTKKTKTTKEKSVVSFLGEKTTNDTSTSDKRSAVSLILPQVEKWLKGTKVDAKQCIKKKKDKQRPNAWDSPIKTFGYPEIKISGQSRAIQRLFTRISLNVYEKNLTPIDVGKEDYLIVGTKDEILAFCTCFEDYKVIGKQLMEDGTWKNEGKLKIQLQNIAKWGVNADVFDIVFKYTLERITRTLNPTGVIGEMDKALLGTTRLIDNIGKIKENIEKLRQWVPFGEIVIKKIISLVKDKTPPVKLVKDLYAFIRGQNEVQKKWINLNKKVIDKGKKIIVTLTMYTKPENKVRATYNFDKATVTLGDIGKELKDAFKNIV